MQNLSHTEAGEDVCLPWEEPASRQFADAIRGRVLELSGDEKTFLVPPPEAVDFTFDFDGQAGVALAVLKADPRVEEQRFRLVPKSIDESGFWRNYFYRVSLIKEAYQVDDGTSAGSAAAAGDDSAGAAAAARGGVGLGGDVATARRASEESDLHDVDDAPVMSSGWGDDDGLDLNDEVDDNFDMLDDDELLASTGLALRGEAGDLDDDLVGSSGRGASDDDLDDDDDDLAARIKAELDLGDDDDDDDA
mmetsp:Transcript_1484/g.4513  ORF Transcript_1484/g.4513 Transcript_1484/m.4513 type:complete len:249 (+) Transcript_1484:1996-2742(+)